MQHPGAAVRPDRRADILRAASELFAEHPYDEVTTSAVAQRAGVAYGLIAHHFTNKRGLYLATVEAAAQTFRSVRDTPPSGETDIERLRDALGRHIDYMEGHAAGFLALVHAAHGTDPQVRNIVETLRWEGALAILRAVGAAEPITPALRAGMRAWVVYLDELIADRIHHHDIPLDDLITLAVTPLQAVLTTAAGITIDQG